MANVNRPIGLVPLEYLDGSPWNGKGRMYHIPSTDPSAYAVGDPVVMSGTGDANGVAGVTLATAGSGNIVLGSILGFGSSIYGGPGAIPGALETTIIPATKTRAYYVLVSDSPAIVYEMQEIGTGTALAATEIGLNANIASGTNSGYVSGWLLDNASPAVTAAFQVQLLGLVQRADNAYGAYAKWKVRINNHQYAAARVGV